MKHEAGREIENKELCTSARFKAHVDLLVHVFEFSGVWNGTDGEGNDLTGRRYVSRQLRHGVPDTFA